MIFKYTCPEPIFSLSFQWGEFDLCISMSSALSSLLLIFFFFLSLPAYFPSFFFLLAVAHAAWMPGPGSGHRDGQMERSRSTSAQRRRCGRGEVKDGQIETDRSREIRMWRRNWAVRSVPAQMADCSTGAVHPGCRRKKTVRLGMDLQLHCCRGPTARHHTFI